MLHVGIPFIPLAISDDLTAADQRKLLGFDMLSPVIHFIHVIGFKAVGSDTYSITKLG